VPLTPAQEGALKPRQAFRECAECPMMVVLPAGRFTMGSPEKQYGSRADEKPVHPVAIPRIFAVGKFEVTVRQFVEFLNDSVREGRFAERWVSTAPDEENALIIRSDEGGSPRFSAKSGHEDFPVTFVSWRGAAEYARWLSRRTGASYRLLSEAEWEYAARAGSDATYHFGEDGRKLCDFGNVADLSGQKKSKWSEWVDCDDGYASLAPVGRFQPNAFGLHDMVGNAGEWVEDCGHRNYEGAPADGSAWVTESDCNSREVRGGSYYNLSVAHRSAKRFENPVDTKYTTIGFRVARSIQQ
jgi:formylglycine-generating enzyme required for sulfatase activity